MRAGTVANPADGYLDPNKSYAGKGWSKSWGFLDGVGGLVDRVGHLTESGAGIAGDIATGKRSMWEVQRDKDEFDQQQRLELFKIERGDNLKLYYAGAAVAVALVVMMGGR